MARSAVVKRATGNQIYPAMVKFLMDGNLTVPTAWDVGFTVTTELDDGTDVTGATVVSADTVGETANDTAMDDLVALLNTTFAGEARFWYQKNTVDEYVVCGVAVGSAALVQVATPDFAASA